MKHNKTGIYNPTKKLFQKTDGKIITIKLILFLFAFFVSLQIICAKETECKKLNILDYKKGEMLVDTLLQWILNNKTICLYNILSKESISRYDLYTFSIIVRSFPFKRLAHNLKNYRNKIECKVNSDIKTNNFCNFEKGGYPCKNKYQNPVCIVYFKGVQIPLFFNIEKSEYIDEQTGKIKKEERLALNFDYDYYITFLDEVKKRYNINLFYDYYRRRGDD